MTRWCLSYNRPSEQVPSHIPGGPAHFDGGKLIEVREDQLAIAQREFPADDSYLSVIEMPEGDHTSVNVADWAPDLWRRCEERWGAPVKAVDP